MREETILLPSWRGRDLPTENLAHRLRLASDMVCRMEEHKAGGLDRRRHYRHTPCVLPAISLFWFFLALLRWPHAARASPFNTTCCSVRIPPLALKHHRCLPAYLPHPTAYYASNARAFLAVAHNNSMTCSEAVAKGVLRQASVADDGRRNNGGGAARPSSPMTLT